MNATLRVLLVEDSPADAILIEHELLGSGLHPTLTRADSEAEIRAELSRQPDLVLADYSLQGFTAIDVLEWYHQSGGDAPFILVSGTIDTETAVSTMRQGASDYILKENISGLRSAIIRALEAQTLRRAKRFAEDKVSFLGRMLDLARDAIIVCDFTKSRIQYWNKGAERLYGFTAAEIMGASIDRVFKYDDKQMSAMMRCLLDAGEWSAETEHVLKNGREAIVSERATLAYDADSRPSAILFIHDDITARKSAEKQIRYQESLLREAGEVARIGSWEVNVLTGVGFATPEVGRIYGLEPEQMPGVDLARTFFHGADRARMDLAFEAAIQEAIPYDLELQFRAADGAVKWVRCVGHPVLERGKVVKIRGIFQDITVQKRAEERLREQARLLDLTSDAILVSDVETGAIIYWNQGAERMHGWTAEEVLGRRPADFLFTNADAGDEILRATAEKGAWSGEIRECAKDGREIIVSSRVTLVRDDAGLPKSLLAIHTDVTERRTLEAQILRAQRLKSVGTLASGIAHDLNNILSPIVLAGPLLDTDLPPDVRKSLTQTINTSARRGVEIVRQVLLFARGMQGQRLPVDCRNLLKEIVSIAGETFPKSIAVACNIQPGIWPALGDSTQLQQILLNLAINARDAMPSGGDLNFSARNFVVDDSFASMMPDAQVGPHVLFQVTDTGTGIPRNIIDKIFDPFFSTKEVGQGSGLGLSSALGIIKSHGGFVTVESKSGHGTTFKVFVPSATEEAVMEADVPIPILPRGNDELILLVEDEPNIRAVAELILQQAGYRVLLAVDGTDALARFAEFRNQIRVVITDAVMPFLDGAALIRALRNLEPALQVIGTSGHDNDLRSNELKAVGLQAFLIKPYDKSTLLTALHELLHEVPHD